MKKTILFPMLFTLAPQAGLAHVGDHGAMPFLSGLSHPVSGADHILAMVAVGLWATMLGGRAMILLPLAFVVSMLVGAGFGAAGFGLPAVEPMILASIVLLGLAAALCLRLPVWAGGVVVAAFGLFHGHAHGSEGPVAGLLAYAAGFALSTLGLHALGLALGLGLQRMAHSKVARVLGGMTAAAGLALAFG